MAFTEIKNIDTLGKSFELTDLRFAGFTCPLNIFDIGLEIAPENTKRLISKIQNIVTRSPKHILDWNLGKL